MQKLLTVLLAAALMVSCVSCGNNAEMEKLKKENEELKEYKEKVTSSTVPTETEKSFPLELVSQTKS